MALFRRGTGGKADVLKRVLAKDWKTKDEQRELLNQLGAFRDLRADELVPLLTTSDATVRAFAEYQLRERLEPKSIGAIIDELPKKTSRTQSHILHMLIRAKPDLAIPHVQRIVQEAVNKDLAIRAMEALSQLPAHQISSEFVRSLGHKRPEIRHLALVKVGESKELMADAAVQSAVAGMADDEEEKIRLRVLEMVSRVNPGDGVRLCLERLKDPSPAVQQQAVRVMGETLERLDSSSDAEDQLLALLTDGSEAIRTGVIEIIMKRPDKDRILRKLLVFCTSLMGWVRDRTLDTLRNYSKEITDSVIRLMGDPDEDVRSMALTVGATLESAAATPHIIKLL